jgi:hypothetical protein
VRFRAALSAENGQQDFTMSYSTWCAAKGRIADPMDELALVANE